VFHIAPNSLIAAQPARILDNFPSAHSSSDEDAGQQAHISSLAATPELPLAIYNYAVCELQRHAPDGLAVAHTHQYR
jgi:hypothetical protein